MSAHQYRITLEYLGGKHAGPDLYLPISFETDNHDDLFKIIQSVQNAQLFDNDTAAALALGMKLFSAVMLEHRKDPLFEPIAVAYRDYIGNFKKRIQEANTNGGGSADASHPNGNTQ
jgi:hypothetical protein